MKHNTLTSWLLSLILLSGILLSACSFKLDVQQGNEVTAEMISEVEIGMSRRQVTKILGLPLITDPFNKNRWDYYYSFKSGETGKTVSQSIKLFFQGDTLRSMDGDVILDNENVNQAN